MRIQYIILTAIVFFLIRYSHDDRIFLSVIYSIVVAILFWYLNGIYTRTMHKKAAKANSYMGREALGCGVMSHVRGIIADGGIAYLLSDSLVFVPHKLSFSQKPFTILLSDIECVSDYQILGMFDTQLKITLKSGKVEKFVVDKTTPFYKMVLDRMRK